MRTLIVAIVVGLGTAVPTPPAAAQFAPGRELRLSFNVDGTVNLSARNVTAREILAEWARQCQCHVVNAAQLPGGAIMMPLQFESAEQSVVLQALLRSAAGYVLTPRRPGSASASNYETIYILATSNPVAGPYVPPPTTVANLPTVGSPDSELPPAAAIPPPAQAPSSATPPAGRSSSPFTRSSSPFASAPSTPTTVPAPGTVTAVPQAPGPSLPGTSPAPQAPPAPPRPGTVVPIVPITPSNP